MVVQNQSELGEGSTNPTDSHHTPTITQSSTQPQKTQKPRKPKRKDTQVATTEHLDLESRAGQGNITKTRSKATPNESSIPRNNFRWCPQCQDTMGNTIRSHRFENVSKQFNDSLLARGNILRSGKDRLKLDELMAICTTLQKKVLDLEQTKTTQQIEIDSLKRRVKKLEKKRSSRTHKLKRLYKVGLTARVESSGDEESLGELIEESSKKQKVDDDKETSELKQCLKIIPDEEEYELKWSTSFRMPHVHISLCLVEKKYPFIPSTLTMMLEKKLQIDYESEMAYQLLKSIIKQLKKK
ncbi:hypothetical protein Tco_1238205 [Tanacetum coccineum]